MGAKSGSPMTAAVSAGLTVKAIDTSGLGERIRRNDFALS